MDKYDLMDRPFLAGLTALIRHARARVMRWSIHEHGWEDDTKHGWEGVTEHGGEHDREHD
ncbi:MAG: hypothetical protein ABF489_06560 [Bifidobacterium sp.]|uniref:hypothetical protein n=1 Tax=Bifidobacterium sp. TaxID=41200 RepID=UPI0039ECE297